MTNHLIVWNEKWTFEDNGEAVDLIAHKNYEISF